ncbi:protein SPMIP2 [Hipposideros larvatus]
MACVTYREPISATVGKRVIFTGPDYKKDHLPKVHPHTSYIGEKRLTLEKTGDLRYLWRPASDRSLPAKYKHEYVGEIGWGIPEYNFINQTRLKSGFHIKCKEINQAAIDKLSHRYQNPWQPKPCIMDMLGKFSRGCIAWNMGDYEDIDQRNSKAAALLRQNKAALPRASRPPKPPKPLKKEEKRRFRPPNQRDVTCY